MKWPRASTKSCEHAMVLLMDVPIPFVSMQYLTLSQKQKYYLVGNQLSPVIKHGFFWSEENVNLNDFQHLMVYECWCVL